MNKINKTDEQNKKKSYYPELYNACKYIANHCQEFQGYELYIDIEKKSEGWDPIALHQRLVAQYRLLIGETKYKENDLVKGAEFFPIINTSKMDAACLAQILITFHDISNEKGNRIDLKKRLIHINIEKTTNLMDYLINEIDPNFNSSEEISTYDTLQKIYNTIYNELKNIISKSGNAENRYTSMTLELKKLFILNKENDTIQNIYKLLSKNIQTYFDAWLFIDLNCYAILQFVIYGIIRNDYIVEKIKAIKKLNCTILELIDQYGIDSVTLKGEPLEIMFKFYVFFFIKDKFLQDTTVLKEIMKKGEKNPEKKYALRSYIPKEDKLNWTELQELFNEGEKKENIKTFKKNMVNSYNGIIKFNKVTGRKMPTDPLFIKTIYRQIYKDSTLYNKRQCKKIFNDFLESHDMGILDYYFIDEKINVGSLREYELMDELYEKNTLQENLYQLVCQVLTKLEPDAIIVTFDKIMNCISNTIHEIGVEYTEKVDSKRNQLFDNPQALKKLNEYSAMLSKYSQELTTETSDQLLEIMKIWFDRYRLYY